TDEDVLAGIELKTVTEGAVRLSVPASAPSSTRGPARTDSPVFYNPAMTLARDVSVSVLRAAGTTDWRVLDGLAGTGVRGVRYAVEGPPPREVVLNDANPVAVALCALNLQHNGVEDRVVVTRERLERLLHRDRFDMVDVDPFGSPAPFMAGAVRAVRKNGLLALTATDTPALCGSRPRPCLRRYGARPWRGDAMHEVALRILAGAAVREAARTDRAAVPMLSMAEDHFVRVFLRVTEGAMRADDALSRMGYAWPTPEGGIATGPVPPGHEGVWAGPMWLGPLHDGDVVASMLDDGGRPEGARLERLLEVWRDEAELPPLLVEANRVASRLKVQTPRMEAVLEGLRSRGYVAGRAHTNPVGIKTDAPMEVLEDLFRDLS
ncbi:MAG: tRNA (guanine(10)-N(2))-dimethyltransferase, partial [Thermoplasmata archaeon]